MKLIKSVLPLKNKLDATVFASPKYKAYAQRIYNDCKHSPHIKDAFKALRYTIWYELTTTERNQVISHSKLPCVGGYYDYYDLDALLCKALPTVYLIKLVS